MDTSYYTLWGIVHYYYQIVQQLLAIFFWFLDDIQPVVTSDC